MYDMCSVLSHSCFCSCWCLLLTPEFDVTPAFVCIIVLMSISHQYRVTISIMILCWLKSSFPVVINIVYNSFDDMCRQLVRRNKRISLSTGCKLIFSEILCFTKFEYCYYFCNRFAFLLVDACLMLLYKYWETEIFLFIMTHEWSMCLGPNW